MNSNEKWAIDAAHSEIAFKVKHLMITNVKGFFKDFSAEVRMNDDHTPAAIQFSAKAASVNTGDEKRDEHLRSADFFDAAQHELITFTSEKIEKTGDGTFNMTGVLTIKGVTKPVLLDAEFLGLMKDPWGNEKAGYSLTGKINRKDWDLIWNVALETGGVLVGEMVQINCEVQLMRQN